MLEEAERNAPQALPGLRPGLGSGAAPGSRVLSVPAGAIALLLVLVGMPDSQTEGGELPSGPLGSFAALAAEQEPAGPFEYVGVGSIAGRAPAELIGICGFRAGGAERYEMRHFEADGKPAGKDEIYLSRERALSCTSAGQGRVPSCEEVDLASNSPAGSGSLGWSSGSKPRFSRPTLRNCAPPSPSRSGVSMRLGSNSGTPTTGPADGVSGFGPTGPFEELTPAIQQTIYNEELFAKLVGSISNPYAPPKLRGASFALMGQLEGVRLRKSVRDGRGRQATRLNFKRLAPSGLPQSGFESYQLFLDPTTTQVLELRVNRGRRLVATEQVIERLSVCRFTAAGHPAARRGSII